MGIVVTLVFLALFALAIVALAPVRRPPLSTFSFMIGFAVDELSGQLLVATLVAVWIVESLGWPSGVPGAAALGASVAAALGFGVLFGCAVCSRLVVARGLARTGGLEVPRRGGRASWLRWWRTWLAVPLRGRAVAVRRDVPYVDDGDPAHLLDVLSRREGAEGAPVLIFVHGGAWTIGAKNQQSLPMLYELASQGWVVVSGNYRLSPKATWPDHIVDVKRLIAWTRAHATEFGGDPTRLLAIAGNSAGGHLAALAALTPGDDAWQPGFEGDDTSVDACVSIYGVLDLMADPATAGPQGRALRSLLSSSVMKRSLEAAPDTYEASSPIHRLTEDAPPFLVLHGTKDTLVSVNVARAFVAAFERVATAPICYVELPWAQHGYDMLCSPRCSATVLGVGQFLEALVAAKARQRRASR